MQAIQRLVQTSVKGPSYPEERLCTLRLSERLLKMHVSVAGLH